MLDFFDLHSTAPLLEDRAQPGHSGYDYQFRARLQANALINQLRRNFGYDPSGARLEVETRLRDLEAHITVICHFDDEIKAALDYANRCRSRFPGRWDEVARRELVQGDSGVILVLEKRSGIY